MKWLRRLVLFLVFAVLAIVVALLTVDPNHFKPVIEQSVHRATGRSLTLEGDLKLNWFPSIGLELGSARIGNSTGFGEKPFARIDQAILRVGLIPLLEGKLEVRKLDIRGLTLNLQVDENGRTNWRDLIPLFTGDPGAGAPLAITLDGVTVTDAAYHFRDAASDLDFAVAPIALTTGPIVMGEPVALSLEFNARSATPPVDAHIQAETMASIDAGPVLKFDALKLSFEAGGEGLPLTLKEGQIAGTVAVDLEKRTLSATPLKGVVVATSPQGVEIQLAATATGTGDLATYRFALQDIRVNLDATGLPLADRWFSGNLESAVAVDVAERLITIEPSRLEMRGEGSRGEDVELIFQGGGDIDLARRGVRFEGLTGKLDAFGVPLGEDSLTGEFTTDITGELEGSGISIGPASVVLRAEGEGGLATDLSLEGKGYIGPDEGVPFSGQIAIETSVRGGTPDTGENRGTLNFGVAGELASRRLLVYPLNGNLSHTGPDGKTTRVALSGNGEVNLEKRTVNLEAVRIDLKARDGAAGVEGVSAELRGSVSAGLDTDFIEFESVEARLRGSTSQGTIFAFRAAGDGRLDPKEHTLQFDDLGLRLRASLPESGASTLEASARTGLLANLDEGKVRLSPVELEWSGIKADGEILAAGLGDSPEVVGSLKVHPFSPRKVLASLGYPVSPQTPEKTLGSGAGLLEFQATAERLALPRFELAVDESRLNGKMNLEPGEPASVVLLASLDRIDLAPYLAAFAQDTPTTPDETADTDTGGFEAFGRLLKAIELRGSIDVGEVRIAGTTVTAINATLRGDEGVLDARPVSASIYEGRARGLFSLDAREAVPRFSLHTEATGVALGNLVADMLGEEAAKLEGHGSLRLDLETSGVTTAGMTRHVKGSIRTEIRRGALRDKALAAKIEIMMALLQARKPRPPGERILFDLLTGTWTADNGVMSNDDLRFDLPIVSFRGKGDIDLNKNQIDYSLYPFLPGRQRDLWLAPITIRGPLADPDYGLDVTRFTREAPKP
ncbi:MAG: AsmA family protein [Pseudomonadota bacterium]|nr:AsmA family protein [Pseudomonadota bacterium]